jgi:ribosomal protein S18 acetylase RimI-like enzyme
MRDSTGSPRADSAEAIVRPARRGRDEDAFFRLPWRLYRGDPMWIPPLKSSARAELRPETNPFLRHCDYELFLLERGGKAAGRIAALVDRIAVESWGEKIGMFGYFECGRGDREGAALLLGAARDWLRSRGMDVMRGPWTFVPQEWGLVVEGFEPEPVVMAPYNPPEYEGLFESFGLRKAKDLLCWEFSMPEGYRIPDRILTLTDGIAKRFGITIRDADFSRFDEEVELFARLSMDTLESNWGITPMTGEEIKAMAKDLRALIKPEHALFARTAEGKDIAFALTIPDLNVILKRTRGRMLPFGWARMLWGIPRLRRYRMFALGVDREYKGKGVDALIYRAMWERMAHPALTMEVNYVLEDNYPMVNAITKLGARPSRRYRVYEMRISAS